MKFIKDNTDLRKYMPNVLREAAGERTFFEKVQPWLESAEQWIVGEILSPEFAGGELPAHVVNWAQLLTASSAMATAIPSLDLVLTPNGYGIVSNQNIAPASKDRVSSLVSSLHETAESTVNRLLSVLFRLPQWRQTECGEFYTSVTLYRPWEVSRDTSYSRYMGMYHDIISAESILAETVVSEGIWEHLRSTPLESLTSSWRSLKVLFMALVRLTVSGADKRAVDMQASKIVQLMRSDKETFALWHNSRTAELWNMQSFKNEKSSHGYFF